MKLLILFLLVRSLTYWNNSPDNLDIVYFHLYQNAFQPDSYYDDLQKQNGKSPNYGKYESQKLGTSCKQFTSVME